MNAKAMKTIGKGNDGMKVIGIPVGGNGGSGGGYAPPEGGIPATDLSEEVQETLNAVGTNTANIATLQAAYAGLTQSDIVVGTLPASGEANTIYRVAGTNTYSDYMWDGTDFVLMATYGITSDGVYDISANHSNASYDNLTAALGSSGANVPAAVRSGGMGVKYLENVYADYDVVVTEGLTTEPTGTELDSAPSITSGTYKASQLAAFSTLPENPYNSVTYYVAVAGDTTTYTQWTITKLTNDSTKYVHWIYTSSSVENADFVKLDNWVGSFEDKAETIEKNAADINYTYYTFKSLKYYIKTDGSIATNNSYRSTGYIPVKEGDVFYYSGNPSTSSRAVYGYSYDGTTYTPKAQLLGAGNTLYKNVKIWVQKGVTHILASCLNSSISSAELKRENHSKLSDIVDGFGDDIYKNIVVSDINVGGYAGTDGAWHTSSSHKYRFFDVEVGDSIYLRDVGTTTLDVAILAKKLSDTPTFKTLIAPTTTGTQSHTYIATENMTVCVSSSTTPSYIVITRNKVKAIDTRISTLETKQTTLLTNKDWLNQYDYKLGYMFNNIAVIGDSMSVGSISTQEVEEPNSNMGASWLSVLAKRWGCKSRMHYAQGGKNCYSFLNSDNAWGLGAMLRDSNVYNAYFIAHGHNDGGTNYSGVGSATDTAATVTVSGTTPSCASGNSFCAYYKAVIDQIRTKAPHAMIFCLSEYDNVVRTKSSSAYRNAIIDIANLYYNNGDKLVYHLETGGVPDDRMDLGSHYSTIGYFHIAKRVDEEANKAIWSHMTDMEIKEFGIYNNVSNRHEQYTITT